MLRRISCDQVRQGMYINAFGGSWFDHPFWRGKFLLNSPQDVKRVRDANVPYVEIDEALGTTLVGEMAPIAGKTAPTPPPKGKRSGDPVEPEPVHRDAKRRKAARLLARSKKVMRGVFEDARLGCIIHSPSMSGVVDDIIEAVTVESQTFLTVARLKSKDDYTYLHSVAVCALMVSVAKFLGKEKSEIQELGIAGLLHDVGKMSVPDEILNKAGVLTDQEFERVRSHPEKGYQLLRLSPGLPQVALDVCRHHHERLDGKGYPMGLSGDQISFAARLGAICDIYDALTSNRAYKKAWLPHKALTEMSRWEGHLDREILAALMHGIDIFPQDLLVTLSNGQLALIIGSDPHNGKIYAAPLIIKGNSVETGQRVQIGRRKGGETVKRIENPAEFQAIDCAALGAKLRAAI